MVYTEELCRLISHNGGNILDNISLDRVAEFNELKDNLEKENVDENKSYQDKFVRYFSLRSYRLKQDDIKRMFKLLELHKEDEVLDSYELAKQWLGEEQKSKFGEKHFSSLTKMMNIISTEYPIYDANVVRLFEFEPPKTTRSNVLRKLNIYTDFYDHLRNAYTEIIEGRLLKDVLMVFKIKLREKGISLDRAKRIDLIMRSTGELKRKEALIAPKYVPAYELENQMV